ncbi:MAG TPA: lysylphosphatidylglycerol synthase transmembrane domain-containing protein, partial [Solirubrobacteraceae bacterium]
PGSGSRLGDPAPGWVVAAVGAELVSIASYAALFWGSFRVPSEPIGFVRSVQIGVGELAAFVVVPTGFGGPALRVWALIRSGMRYPTIVRRSVIQGVFLNVPYALSAAALGLAVALGAARGRAPVAVALAPLALTVVGIAILLVVSRAARGESTRPLTRWRRIGWETARGVTAGVRELPGALRRPWPVLGGIGYWAGDCAVLILAFHAVHASVAIDVVVPAYMLGQLGNTLPLPGGVGGVEPIMLGILTASGVDAGLAGAAIILYRLISLGLQTVLGGLATASLIRSLGPRGTGAVTSVSGPAAAGTGIDPPRRPSEAESSIGIGTSAGTSSAASG